MISDRLLSKMGVHGTSRPAGEVGSGAKIKDPFEGNFGRALVVDDEPTMVNLVGMMLEGLGFQVNSANGGMEAKLLLDQGKRFDLVVTDLNMPHLDGFELAGWVKHYSRDTRVVIMSGCLTYSDLRRCSKGGIVDTWIAKPFDSRELETVLRELRMAGNYR